MSADVSSDRAQSNPSAGPTSLAVLYVVHGFPPHTWAGTEIYTLNLAQAMQRLGHRVTILSRAPQEAGAGAEPEEFVLREDRCEGLRVLRLAHALRFPSLRETYDEPRIEAVFGELLAREHFDVVHFQHLIHLSVTLVDVARRAGCATVLHLHDFWGLCARVQLVRPDGVLCPTGMGLGCYLCIKNRHFRAVPWVRRLGPLAAPFARLAHRVVHGTARRERKRRTWLQKATADVVDVLERPETVLGAFARADLLVSPSRFVRERLLATGRFAPDQVLYSPNGMRTEHLAGRGRAERPRVSAEASAGASAGEAQSRVRVGFIGTLIWYKGVHVLVEALQRLRGQPIELAVFGPFDPEHDPYHARLAELAGPNVEFRGRFDNSKLADVHDELDVLCVPSVWYENAPVTMHEAWLVGTPVVASRLGGMAELVEDGQNGLLFEAGDPDDLARVLLRFVREPSLGAALAARAPHVRTAAEDASALAERYGRLVALRRSGSSGSSS